MSIYTKLGLVACALGLAGPAWAQDSDADGAPDAADVYPCDATRAAVSFFPGEGARALLAFEDQWPNETDLDFNDVVVRLGYRFELDAAGRVVSLTALVDPVALGGVYSNGLGLALPVDRAGVTARRRVAGGAWQDIDLETDANVTVQVSPNLRELFAGQSGRINADSGASQQVGSRIELQINFATAVALDLGLAPFDVFIFRAGGFEHQIHFPEYAGTAVMNAGLFGTGHDGSTTTRRFVHSTGIPAALNLMAAQQYPVEATRVSQLFPDVLSFASSSGTTHRDFYRTNTVPEFGRALAARAVLPTPTSDTSCLPAAPGADPSTVSDLGLHSNGLTIIGGAEASIYDILASDLVRGRATFVARWSNPAGGTLESNVELVELEGSQVVTSALSLGDPTRQDSWMLLVRVSGDLTVESGGSITANGRKRGLFLMVEGSLVNAGSISMTARGAVSGGQNVRLLGSAYVPAGGGGGAGRARAYGGSSRTTNGGAGGDASGRATGGGGAGRSNHWRRSNGTTYSGAGSAGTSYSGGSGGGGISAHVNHSSTLYGGNGGGSGGAGGGAYARQDNCDGRRICLGAGGGAGNGGGARRYHCYSCTANNGSSGTGGLLVIYARGVDNRGTLASAGSRGGSGNRSGGGGSGGGSINVFFGRAWQNTGTVNVAGGASISGGGRGGNGSFTATRANL